MAVCCGLDTGSTTKPSLIASEVSLNRSYAGMPCERVNYMEKEAQQVIAGPRVSQSVMREEHAVATQRRWCSRALTLM